MEDYLKSRPKKTIFPLDLQLSLRRKAVDKIIKSLLPDAGIEKIILIGSSVKETFGEYDQPGFRGSLFSDFDFIIFVNDDYLIPNWLTKEPNGRPFSDENNNLAYRQKRFVEEKFDCEIFFIYHKNIHIPEIVLSAERAGIPLNHNSSIKHIAVYPV